jgi:hypothetical protein
MNNLIGNCVVGQSIGGAYAVSAANSLFANELLQAVRTNVPSMDPKIVVATGANSISSIFPADVLPGILKSYTQALRLTFALGIPLSGVAFILSFFQPWFRFDKGQKTESKADTEKEADVENTNEPKEISSTMHK